MITVQSFDSWSQHFPLLSGFPSPAFPFPNISRFISLFFESKQAKEDLSKAEAESPQLYITMRIFFFRGVISPIPTIIMKIPMIPRINAFLSFSDQRRQAPKIRIPYRHNNIPILGYFRLKITQSIRNIPAIFDSFHPCVPQILLS